MKSAGFQHVLERAGVLLPRSMCDTSGDVLARYPAGPRQGVIVPAAPSPAGSSSPRWSAESDGCTDCFVLAGGRG